MENAEREKIAKMTLSENRCNKNAFSTESVSLIQCDNVNKGLTCLIADLRQYFFRFRSTPD